MTTLDYQTRGKSSSPAVDFATQLANQEEEPLKKPTVASSATCSLVDEAEGAEESKCCDAEIDSLCRKAITSFNESFQNDILELDERGEMDTNLRQALALYKEVKRQDKVSLTALTSLLEALVL